MISRDGGIAYYQQLTEVQKDSQIFKIILKGSFSLYELLKKHYDVEATRTSSAFEVSMPENPDTDILRISPKIPLLVVKSTAKDRNGEAVEYCVTKFRGDICSIAMDFNGEGR